MIETSENTAKLDAALAKAQGEIEAASKDKVNPAFRSKYADLTSVWAAIRPALCKHGISITQWPVHSTDGRLHIVTRLAHDGEWIRAHFSIPVVKQDPHGYGSATTYAKRFSLAACVGVVADDDDDGNAASQRPSFEPKQTAVRSPPQREQPSSVACEIARSLENAPDMESFEDLVKETRKGLNKLADDGRSAWSKMSPADRDFISKVIADRRATWMKDTFTDSVKEAAE